MDQTNRGIIKVLAILTVVAGVVLAGCGPNKPRQEEGMRTERVYWPGGKLRREVTLKDSLRHGPSRSYYRSGAMRLATQWENGQRVGEAVTYYEDGAVYQVTPFEQGVRHGIQRRYYPSGELMAEMPYRAGELVEGLREYSKSGRLLTPQAHIVLELDDRLDRNGTVRLVMRLSDGCERIQFNRRDTIDGRGFTYPLITTRGEADLLFHLAPGQSLSQKVYLWGGRQSPLGSTEIFSTQYLVKASRPKE